MSQELKWKSIFCD